MLVKMGSSSPMFRGENSKNIWVATTLSCHFLECLPMQPPRCLRLQKMSQGLTKNHHDPFIMAPFTALFAPGKDVASYPWNLMIFDCFIGNPNGGDVNQRFSYKCLMLVFWALGILWKKAMSLGWLKTALLSRWSMISVATNRWSITYWWKWPTIYNWIPGPTLWHFHEKLGNKDISNAFSCWWLNQPLWKILYVKLDPFPRVRGENKNLRNHQPVISWIYPPGSTKITPLGSKKTRTKASWLPLPCILGSHWVGGM